MSHIFRIIVTLAALCWSCFALAQTASEAQDDRGYLQALLEDNLSDVGRDIRIIGFQGALSSRATVDQITIADEEGIWLTLNDLVLSWTRSSLLRGAINIDQIQAKEIILARKPIPIGGPAAPEASGFSLPELPVSVEIGVIKADRVEIAQPVIGEATVVRLEGSANLSGGEGAAKLSIVRTDGPSGALQFEGSYSNTTEMLDLTLAIEEGEDGIAANLLDLPGRPSIGLTVAGAGPLSNFIAEIDLSTDGAQRLTGQVEVMDELDDDASTPDNPVKLKRFAARLSGDIAPVFLPDYRDFFGDNVALTATGRRFADGALDLETLELTTKALTLQGDLAVSEGGWPERFRLQGKIAHDDGSPVVLPVGGTKTQVQTADIAIGYDAANGEAWQADFALDGMNRDDLALETATITAAGTLVRGEGVAVGRLDGDIMLDVLGIAPTSDDLARAIGPALAGTLSFDWREDAPLQVTDIDLAGTDYGLTGSLSADDLENGITVTTNKDFVLTARDLSQFAGLAGTPLTGAASVAVKGTANLLGGSFDLAITGDGTDLGIGQPRLDPLIAGASRLDVKAVRDETGTRLERLNITTDQTVAAVTADLKTDASTVQFDVRIKDAAVVDLGLSGPATAKGSATQTGDIWAVLADVTAPGGVAASVDGTVNVTKDGPGLVRGTLTAKAASLAPYARLAGRPISGAISATTTGSYDLATNRFEGEVDGSATNLGLGLDVVDGLTRGASTFMARAHGTSGEVVFIDALSIDTPEVTAQATGQEVDGRNTLTFQVNLRDVGVVASGISGPGSANGTATLVDDSWQLSASATGPGGATGRVDGAVRSDASTANLTINGTAPLELANRFIQPRLLTGQAAYDLTLNGPLKLSSLSGRVQTTGARLTLPTFKQALDITAANAVLSDGRARVDITTSVVNGGQVITRGNVGLSSPYQADLDVDVDQVTLTDGNLFDTTVDGSATLRGPLVGGATLRADMTLGRTEIRISDVPASTVPIIAELDHINEAAASRQTRAFAGLIVETDPAAAGGTARPYPVDITLRAPSQIFVRGRGLDAELGGQLRLTGTSADVRPVGQFDLIRGRLDILGKRLTLTEGRVSLRGAFDPYLRFAAVSQSDDITVSINVIGPVSAPEVTFTSSPALPEDEVLARLLFGRSIADISALQALQLAAAVRTLAGKGGDGIIGNLRKNFGLDDLDLTTNEDGEASLSVGKYISENIYTNVNIGADGNTEVNLNLTISPSVTARGTVGSDGESTIGIYYERDY
ncbi:translocation/assembly module TamB domain-containing protein [Aliiroseovarius sp. Z3]|uniref:translocation/assembly module TamB domain-containing protein n=1 Tax=Aliiroseovarius sp. Z3 TaxID=2811402 RepID=UPI0023B2A02C|nr:translocation/assembly module TamB domain-containing protein [Aliiroseovarius sp. Z3]MDE9451626.1 translocation/assembly module TamB domain-containing protein [Aliiroseovarius sp. Z3]